MEPLECRGWFRLGEAMQILNRLIQKLSQLLIDVDKGWGGRRITNIGAPTTAGDALRKGTRVTVIEMPDGSDGNVLTAKGAGIDPAYEALAAAKVSSGTYSGNSTSNRGIAHGLGVMPKIVLITRHEDSGVECWYRIMGGLNRIFWQWSGAVSPSGRYAVTAPDANNFYVGNSSDYARSANWSGDLHYWVAIA